MKTTTTRFITGVALAAVCLLTGLGECRAAYTFRYYKFAVTANQGSNFNQIGEFHCYSNGVWIAAPAGSATQGIWSDANDNNCNGTKLGGFSATYSLTYDFGAPTTLDAYNWATGDDSASGIDRSPKNWTVQGSDDGSIWVPLDTQTDYYNINLNDTWAAADSNPAHFNAFTTSDSSGAQYAFSFVPPFPGLDHFDITGITSPLTAGTLVSLTITAKDSSDVTLTTYTGAGNTVTFGGAFSGTSGEFTAGVLNVDKAPTVAGSGMTLVVAGGGKVGISSTFTVNPGDASKLGFGQQPTTTAPGVSISPAVTVLIQDADGNTVTGDSSTDVTISGTTFSNSTLTVKAVSGVATFSNLKPMTEGNGITLVATSSPVLASATSSTFAVNLLYNPPPNGNDWYMTSDATWTSTSGSTYPNGNLDIPAWFGIGAHQTSVSVTLTQTGGTIRNNVNSYSKLMFGYASANVDASYVMSGSARFKGKDVYFNDNNSGSSTWSLTGNAAVSLTGNMGMGGGNTGRLLLSGAATFSAASINNFGADSYISFTNGTPATLTVTGAHDFTAWVNAGYIRVDGAMVTMSSFAESGNTLSLHIQPIVNNDMGATNIGERIATLHGDLSVMGSSTVSVFFCYGTTDAGTGSWENVVSVGDMMGVGTFSNTVRNLYSGTTYYYRALATNEYGLGWAPASTNFATLRASGMMILIE